MKTKKSTTSKRPRLEELIPDEGKRKEVLRRLYKGDPVVGDGGIFTDLLQALVNAALEGEMDSSISTDTSQGISNRRNGHNRKIVRSNVGPLEILTPRDRQGNHDPILVKKWERDLGSGLDDIILSLYARGHSIDDVRYQLRNLYGVEVSSGTISAITDRVWTEIVEWQERLLPACFAIIYLDAIHFKIREEGVFQTKAVYTCYGIGVDGQRDILGLYLGESEGAKQWGLILEDIKTRGVEDVLFFCVDGLKGFKEVIGEIYPQSTVQRCIVHMVRNSVRFVSDKDIRQVCADLRTIYTSVNRQQAAIALEAFREKWHGKYKEICPKWESNWDELMAFMDFGTHIRRMIYTTNPVEALHRIMRKVTKSKGAWINDKSLLKQLYLSLMHNQTGWKRKAFGWVSVQRELIDFFGNRYEQHL